MYINEAIRQIMKKKGISLTTMANSLGKKRGNDVSARLVYKNMSISSAIEMLNVLGYELIIQEKKQGARRDDQIVISLADNEGDN